MKRHLLFLVFILFFFSVNAQNGFRRSFNLGLQYDGIALNYDCRFKKNQQWGYNLGFAFGYAQSSSLFGSLESLRSYSVPMGMSYLVWPKKHTLEVGLGQVIGLYNQHYNKIELVDENYDFILKKSNQILQYFYGNVGYRYTANRGFQFRLGFTPVLALMGGKNTNKGFMMGAYITFGKAF